MKTSILVLLFLFPLVTVAEPPFGSTNHLANIASNDPTTYIGSVYEGVGERIGPYGFSFEETVTVEAYLFRANYTDGPSVEFQIHPEFGSMKASSTAVEFYGPIIGQLPYAVRNGLKNIWVINGDGDRMLGGHGGIYTHYGLDQRNVQPQYGEILEEKLAHEASHASLDDLYKNSKRWLEAVAADGQSISVYGRDNPIEDPTQSFLAWLGLRYRPDRLTAWERQMIAETIPNRIAFYDSLHLNVEPMAEFKFLINAGLNDAWFNPATQGQGFFITVYPSLKKVFLAWFTYDVERPPADATAMLGEPGHRWLTAFGDYVDDTATLEIEITQGGVFDSVNPVPTQSIDGTLKLEFADCLEGFVSYEITSLGLQGKIPIQRIVNDNLLLCQSLNEPLLVDPKGLKYIGK